MISIQKSPNPPESLNLENIRPALESIIQNQAYDKKYDKHYKSVKTDLLTLYHNKCAYCEEKVEELHVEHFRPKKTYYWLAFSWDNLILACPTCNKKKGTKFDTVHEQVTYQEGDIELVHRLSQSYHHSEANKLIHPELEENVESLLTFGKDGSVSSEDERMQYTIDTCKLNREYLQRNRKDVWQDFKTDRDKAILDFQKDKEMLRRHIQQLMKSFIEKASNPKKSYLAFRRYAISHFLAKP